MRSSVLVRPEMGSITGFDIITDTECDQLYQQGRKKLQLLRADPSCLTEFLTLNKKTGRLGDHFETLLSYWLKELLSFSPVIQGLPIRNEKSHTLGELDLIFGNEGRFRHWEVAVKFYMCVASSPQEATQAKSFVGQSLLDRLDLKLNHLFSHQLPMARHPLAQQQFLRLGVQGALSSQLFMKGRLFYPLSWDWENIACPPEVAPHHERGWWIAWDPSRDSTQLPHSDYPDDPWVLLQKSRWLSSSFSIEDFQSSELLDRVSVVQALNQHFSKSQNAVQISRVGRATTHVSRGMILTPGWPSIQGTSPPPERVPKEFFLKT